jgi:threonine synthase
MDVGAPSNFARMLAIFGGRWEAMRKKISGFACDDAQTRTAIREVRATTGYVIDPHGAVGWLAARTWREAHPGDATIVLETAHPAKFSDVIAQELGADAVTVPERLACLATREKVAVPMTADEERFREWLLTADF